jgi:drug/metabolite transporter (DMT)-like permease
MLAILGGLGAALSWATASMSAARASRAIGPWSTLGWVMLIGTAIVLPATVLWGGSPVFTPEALLLLAASGAGNIVGLLLAYVAFGRGKVAVVAPILSTEGATAAVISVVLGEQIAIAAAAVLAIIVVGIVLASSGGPNEPAAAEPGGLVAEPRPDGGGRPVVPFALGAVICFGIGLYASGRIGASLGIVWSILPARLGGALFVGLPLAATRRLRLTRAAIPFVLVIGVVEVLGTAAYAFGARDGIAVAAVTSSQFGAIAALVSVVAFGERLRRTQVVGIVVIALGVAALAAVRASG